MQVTNINSTTNSTTNFKAVSANKALRRALKAKHNLTQHLVSPEKISINYTLDNFDKFRAFYKKKLFTGKTQVGDTVYKFKKGVLVAQGKFDEKGLKISDYEEFLPSGYIHERYSENGITINGVHLPNVNMLGQKAAKQKSPFPVIV